MVACWRLLRQDFQFEHWFALAVRGEIWKSLRSQRARVTFVILVFQEEAVRSHLLEEFGSGLLHDVQRECRGSSSADFTLARELQDWHHRRVHPDNESCCKIVP